MKDDSRSMLSPSDLTRRGFVVTSLAAGFALAVQPVSAQTITTDTTGLEAGEVKIPVSDGQIPAYRAMPDAGGPFPVDPGRAGDLRRSRAHQGYLPPPGQAGLSGHRHRALRPPRRRLQDRGLQRDHLQGRLQGARRPGDVRPGRDRCLGQGNRARADTARLGITGFCWGGRIVWLYSAHNPNLKAGVAWYGRLVGEPDALHPKHPIDLAGDIKAPVLGLYGGADQGIPIASIDQMRAALKEANKTGRDHRLSRHTPRLLRRLPPELSQGSGPGRLETAAGVVQETRRGVTLARPPALGERSCLLHSIPCIFCS